MASFEVKVQRIFIKEHPNADALELGNIGDPNGWQAVCRKGLYKTGDLVAYIGENAVVPEWVLKKYGFWNEDKGIGLLAGSKGDRVKMVKLRGESSMGICIPVEREDTPTYYSVEGREVFEGDDVSELLGVVKYEPPIPTQLAGQVFNASTLVGVNYDIEDIKNFPQVLVEGEEVQMTVKIHGSNLQAVWMSPGIPDHVRTQVQLDNWIEVRDGEELLGYVAIASKGQGAQGLFFKDNEENANNAYLKVFRQYLQPFARVLSESGEECVTIVGEVFGKGIQTFDYGYSTTTFRCFDLYLGYRGQGGYVDDLELDEFALKTGIPRVPVVYRGPYSYAILDKLANDKETEFECKHVREGVIVKPKKERRDPVLGRVALKHRSVAYMTKITGEEVS